MFSDTVHYLARDGDVEIWKFINLSPDSHPIHIHLVQFKVLARDAYSEVKRVPAPPAPATAGKATDGKGAGGAGGYEIHFNQSAQPIQLDEAERGWKDTVRVNPSEMTTIAVPFRDYADSDTDPDGGQRLYMTGRYMYHCHILEHEDHEMMRPYVVMPPEVVDHMHGTHSMHGMHGADAASQAPGTTSSLPRHSRYI
jgi:spore coat protein A